jgi:hypothetical protein
MGDAIPRPNMKAVLNGLKDFQRETVAYVFRRLYLDQDSTNRFLIADEVGLGKTLVARGLIAATIDYLWDKVGRIDIVYICSNSDIARQNINRLNVVSGEKFALASRITLLPTLISDLRNSRVNFVSFTPGTSFDLKTSLGAADERVLLYYLLKRAWNIPGAAPVNLLSGWMSAENFRWRVDSFDKKIDDDLAQRFVDALDAQPDLRVWFEKLCPQFNRSDRRLSGETLNARSALIGDLRALLARTCLSALEPDLIILDEFQRFKNLLEGTDEAGELARHLFDWQSANPRERARVLLLSATPYKMFTMSHEVAEDDHYADFLRTLQFLQPNPAEFARLQELLIDYRRELFRLGNGAGDRLPEITSQLEARLRKVMVRTERLAVTADRNGMLVDTLSPHAMLAASDLKDYLELAKVAEALEQYSPLEYWKSAPYLLNFMDDYQLKRSFEDGCKDDNTRALLEQAIDQRGHLLLPWQNIEAYAAIDPSNARLRSLMVDTLGTGAWQWLWLPPALPYYQLQGPYVNSAAATFTKRLVFSSWRVVPKVIAALLSYEAERQMFHQFDQQAVNSQDYRKKYRQLRFARSEDGLTGMPQMALLYPCVTLMRECDPVMSQGGSSVSPLPTIEQLTTVYSQRIFKLLAQLQVANYVDPKGAEDKRWYWAAPILLDLQFDADATSHWLKRDSLADTWSDAESETDEAIATDDAQSAWADHVNRLQNLTDELRTNKLGRAPQDLPLILARIAIGGFGVCSLRSVARMTGSIETDIRDSAAQCARSFITLFNLPEVTALVRGLNGEEPYWQRVLEYSVNGGLQAVLDEYAHVLRDSLGLFGKPAEESAAQITESMSSALTLRTSRLGVDEVKVSLETNAIETIGRGMRGRFALRFGNQTDDESGADSTRATQVQTAFNSPFWPFVLATTSVGQEGLDFHTYCHAVVHWNLPPNPVDLEQREGRVHRYKGHAVRKNLAQHYGLQTIQTTQAIAPDPWTTLFDRAKADRVSTDTDLVPYWVYSFPGGAKIERYVPILPLSRDVDAMNALRRSLAAYRMVFGQSRQEDMLKFLLERLPENMVARAAGLLRIDLSPRPPR